MVGTTIAWVTSSARASSTQPCGLNAGSWTIRRPPYTDVSTVDPTPLFPFGHGLGYGSATWAGVRALTGSEWATDGTTAMAPVVARLRGR